MIIPRAADVTVPLKDRSVPRKTHLVQYVGEYTSILRAASIEGWLANLLAAHMTPCDEGTALRILGDLPLPRELRVTFRNRRGRAGYRNGRHTVALPNRPGAGRVGRLRIGIVLHEAAHILDRRRQGRMTGHGTHFQQELRHLVCTFPWRRYMGICSDYSAVYDRHRGPFTLLLTRETTARKKGEDVIVHSVGRERGPFSAEDAHDTARMLIDDPRDNVVSAFVYSESEGQFIGAYYERGQTIPAWSEYVSRRVVENVDDATRSEEQAPVQPREADQPLPGMAADVVAEPTARKPRVQRVPAAAGVGKRGSALTLDKGNAERWPKSEGAQLVRGWFETGDRVASSKEAVTALGEQLKAIGVEFPASLISRLKQAGFLKEVA